MKTSPACTYFIFQLLWTLLLAIIALDKILFFGLHAYVIHFTNWSWTFNALFYASTLAFWVPRASVTCLNVRCAGHAAAACFFPLNAIVWFVAIAVFTLLLTDPEFITDLFDTIDEGVVIVGNDIFHMIPVLALVFFVSLQHHLLYYGLNAWFSGASTALRVFLYLYEIFLGSLLVIAAYFITLAALGTSVNEVYGSDIPVGAGIAFFLLVALAVNGVPLLILSLCYNLNATPTYPQLLERRVYTTNYVLFGDVEPDLQVDTAAGADDPADAAGAGGGSSSTTPPTGDIEEGGMSGGVVRIVLDYDLY